MARDFSKDLSNYVNLGSRVIGAHLDGAEAISFHVKVTFDTLTKGDPNFDNMVLALRIKDDVTFLQVNVQGELGAFYAACGGRTRPTMPLLQALGAITLINEGDSYDIGGVLSFVTNDTILYVNGALEQTATDGSPNEYDSTLTVNASVSDDTLGGDLCPPTDTSFQIDGAISELSIWRGNIGADAFAALHTGVSATMIRPDILKCYMRLIGRNSPEIDEVGGATGTITGTVGNRDHPRIFYSNYRNYTRAVVDYVYDRQITFGASAVVAETVDHTFGASALVSRWSTFRFQDTCPHFRVLVEIDWPGGSARYADSSLIVGTVGYDGRLCDISTITVGSNGRKDSCTLKIQNLPRLVTIESVWDEENPPEGAAVRIFLWFKEDGTLGKVPIFYGIVDEVTSVTEEFVEISLISTAEFDEVRLGRDITLDRWPDAPTSSVGKMEPFVFGTVLEFEPPAVTEVGKSAFAATALKADTTVYLEDVSRFADTGTIAVGEETATYTGRNTTTNTLTGVSARTLDYASGVEVRESTTLTFLLAQHAVSAPGDVKGAVGDRVKVLDSSLYSTSLLGPSTLSFPGGWPQIDVPSGGSQFTQVQFDVAGTGNTATNPLSACADDTAWTEKNYATVAGAGNKLVVKQDDAVVSLGQIIKAWAMVEYDGTRTTVAAQSGNTVVWKLKEGSTDLGTLTELGNLPVEIKNQAGALGMTRAYNDDHTLSDPTHSHAGGGSVTEPLFNDSIVSSTWGGSTERVVDGNLVSASANPGGSPQLIRAQKLATIADKGTLTAVVARIRVQNTGGVAINVRVVVGGSNHNNSTTAAAGFDGTKTINVFSGGPTNLTTWSQFNASNVYIEVDAGTLVAGAVQVAEMWWEVTYTPNSTSAAATAVTQTTDSPLINTVAFLGDVTALAAGDWSWFLDRNITVEHISGTVVQSLRVVRMCFVIEYAPTRLVPVDRVLVDVTGLNSDGKATDILRTIMTSAIMLNKPTTAYGDGDLTLTQDRLDVMGALAVERAPGATTSNNLSLSGSSPLSAAIASMTDASFAYWTSTAGDTKTGTVTLASWTKSGATTIVEMRASTYRSGNGVVVTVELLSGATVVATITSTAGGAAMTERVSWRAGDLTQGEIDALSVRVTITAGDGSISGTGRVYGVLVTFYAYGEPHRLDFAVTERISAADLIQQVCDNSRMRFWYEEGSLRTSFMEDPADIVADPRTIRVTDIPEDAFPSRKRTPFRDVVTILTGNYYRDYREGRLSGAVEIESPSTIGRPSPASREFPLIRDASSARSSVLGGLLRSLVPHYTSDVTTRLPFLDYRVGEALRVLIGRIAWTQAEIDTIVIDTKEAKVTFSVVVFDSL